MYSMLYVDLSFQKVDSMLRFFSKLFEMQFLFSHQYVNQAHDLCDLSWCILCTLWSYPSELAKQCESALSYVQGGGVEIISYNKVSSQVIRRNFNRPGLADPKLCTFIWASRTQKFV